MRLCTKFQVSSSTRFEDTLGCTKFQVSTSTRFGDTLGCTPKYMGVT